MKKLLLSTLLSATVGMRSSFFSTKNFILPLFLFFFISIHVNAQLVKCSSVSFATATNYATTGTNPDCLAIADLNGDGKLDMVVPANGGNSHGSIVDVFLGNGDGSFQPKVPYSAGNEYQMGIFGVAIADLNGDGKPDLVTANSGTNDVSVLLGNGDGTFQGPVIYATGSAPWSVAIGDFNGDGKPDLVTANSGSDNVSVLLGNGDGTFQGAVTYATGSQPTSVAIGDFNGDGKLDLAIANSNNWNVSVLLGNGDGTFKTQVTFASGHVTWAPGPYSVAIADFNGDGKLDLATTNPFSPNNITGAGSTVSILLGNGDGTFQPQIFSQAADGSQFLAVGDFNGDGKPDLVTTSYYYYLSILLGNGNGTFQTPVSYDPGNTHVRLPAVGDFNGDGRLDVATVGSDQVLVLLNNCTASQITVIPPTPITTVIQPTCALPKGTILIYPTSASYTYSIDSTNYPSDTSFSGLAPGTYYVTAKNSKGYISNPHTVVINPVPACTKCSSVSFATATNYATGTNPAHVATADLNGDGKLDLVVPGGSSRLRSGFVDIGVFLGNGDGTFQPQVPYSAGNEQGMGTFWVAIADLNGDGKLDLATANSGTDDVSVLLGNGDGTFQAAVIYATGSAPWSVAIGDFNGDGKPDLVTANSGSDNVSVLLGNGDGTFQAPPPTDDIQGNGGVTIPPRPLTYATGSQPTSVAIGDFNGDGKPDLAIANSGSDNVSILLGNGDGTFQTQVTYASGRVTQAQRGPYSVAIGDFNGDGKLDLATTNPVSVRNNGTVGPTVSILLGNGDGTFQPQVISGAADGSQFLAIGDFDGDGKPDLATTSYYYYFSVLLGNGDGTFQTAVSYDPGNVHVGSPAVGDFNGDGRLDVATAGSDQVLVLLNNCTASHQCTSPPAASVTQPNCIVTTGTITVTAPNNTGYSYSVDGTNYKSDTSFTGLNPGTYYVTLKTSDGCVSSADTVVVNNVPPSCTNCTVLTHNAYTNFNASSNPGTATTLWLNVHTKLTASQLINNGDYVLFYNGKLSFNGIGASFGNSASVPAGEIIADNSVSAPATSFNSSTNMWLTKVPPGYASSDIFISGAAITSTNGYPLTGGAKSTVLSGKFISNKSFSSSWFYGLACYQPTFDNTTVGSVNAANGIPAGGRQAGTPNNQTTGLVHGGSGGGGSNYTGGYSSTDNFTACLFTSSNSAVVQSEDNPRQNLPAFEAKLFPNPSSGEFTLQLRSSTPQTAEIMVMDILGHVIYRTRGDVNSSYKFGQGFLNGIYFVKIVHSSGVKIIKMVKQ